MAARKIAARSPTPPRGRLRLAWYDRRDYPRLLEICRGGCLLPPDWDAWHRQAIRLERLAREQQVVVDRIEVMSADVMHWARRRRWRFVDADRLHLYVDGKAARQDEGADRKR